VNPPLISGRRFPDLLASPPDASASWRAFSVHVHAPSSHGTAIFSDHLVGLRLSGGSRLHQEVGGRSSAGWVTPGCAVLVPAGQWNTWESRSHSGSPLGVATFVPDAFLARVIAEDWGGDPKRVEVFYRFLIRDPVIEGVLTRLAFETQQGSPMGSIYAESACEFLVHHIIRAHSSLAAPPPRYYGGLPRRSLRLVLDYIEENLSKPITLRQLAELGGVSPRHFERAFRQDLGIPPHGYVLQRRVDAARHLLVTQPALSIHEISKRAGFSSSSHLASAFRRQTGYTPTAFRRLRP